MARKPWVLDTETKGTGAEMVPLEKVQRRRRSSAGEPARSFGERPWRRLRRRQPVREEPARGPRRFRVVDVMTRRPLAEDVGTREALAVLSGVRSVVDVTVYLWDAAGRDWRPLTYGEQKLLWDHRGDGDPAAVDSGLPAA